MRTGNGQERQSTAAARRQPIAAITALDRRRSPGNRSPHRVAESGGLSTLIDLSTAESAETSVKPSHGSGRVHPTYPRCLNNTQMQANPEADHPFTQTLMETERTLWPGHCLPLSTCLPGYLPKPPGPTAPTAVANHPVGRPCYQIFAPPRPRHAGSETNLTHLLQPPQGLTRTARRLSKCPVTCHYDAARCHWLLIVTIV